MLHHSRQHPTNPMLRQAALQGDGDKRNDLSNFRNGSLPSPEQLVTFMSVVDRGSLSAAARDRYLSTSTLSRQIGQIEALCGCRLLTRGQNGMRPTPEGEILYGVAQRSLRELHEAMRRLRDGAARSVLNIATVTGPMYSVLPRAAAAFHARYPDHELLLTETTTKDACDGVRRGQFDLGIVNLPVGNDLDVEPLATTDLSVIVGPGHPLTSRESVELAALRSEPFVLLTKDHTLHHVLLAACNAAGFTPGVHVYARDMLVICFLVSKGLGISIVPLTEDLKHIPNVYRLRLIPSLQRTLVAVRLQKTPETSLLIAYIHSLFSVRQRISQDGLRGRMT